MEREKKLSGPIIHTFPSRQQITIDSDPEESMTLETLKMCSMATEADEEKDKPKPTKYQCEICNHYFPARGHLKIHMRTHTVLNRKQDITSAEIQNEESTSSVLEELNKDESEESNSSESDEEWDARILETLVNKTRKKSGPRKPRKKYQCRICNTIFEAMCHIKVHMRTHTGEKPFACYLCDYRSARLYDLQTHVLIHSGKKRYPCGLCPASFNQRNVYERHKKAHIDTDEMKRVRRKKIHYCKDCGKDFSSKKLMLEHTIEHYGRKPFPCDICNKSFMRQYDLKVHLRIHTGEKPYTCKICKLDFRQHGNYKKHLRTHVPL